MTKRRRGGRKGQNLHRQMEIRCYQQKKDYLIYEIFYTNLMVTTKQKIRAESQNIKKEETEKHITENHQTEWQTETRGKRNNGNVEQPENKRAVLSHHISIITLNVNGLNSPIKRHRVAEAIKKQDPTICCLQETYLSSKDKHRLKVKGWKMILQTSSNQKESECSHTYIRQNRLQATRDIKRQRWMLYNDKRNIPPRIHNTY